MDFMLEALKESDKAFNEKEVPIGAVLVMNNKIIAKDHNRRISDYDVTSHAEINVIRKGEKKLKDWRLSECDLYVTLKPCSMCMSVIKEARIKNVYYLLDKLDNKLEYNKTNVCVINNATLINKYKVKLTEFFKLNANR